jgi:TolA protein
MEPLDKAIPKRDLVTGIGTSLLVHVLIFGGAILSVMLMPHKPLPAPYCSVDLVSMNDIGAGSAEPKGEAGATGRGAGRRVQHHAASHRTAGPVVPIRRLAVNEAVGNKEPHIKIKQIAPKDTPVTPERARGVEAIDKNLDKLVARPKRVTHVAPAPRHAEHKSASARRSSSQAEKESEGRSSEAAENETGGQRSNVSAEERGGGGPAGGTSTGRGRGGRQGTSPGGSAYGSPNGTAAASRILGMYGQLVKEKIQREWNLANDQGVNGLRTVLQVQITGSGQIVRVVVMQRSGNSLFDDSAVRAVNRSGPLPPIPEAARASVSQYIQFILTFKPGKVA